MSDTVRTLPGAERWRPTRAGLVALWRYWDETFTFHHGRLLLRGPNGSGKSMALELLLPFLLDGDASPARLTSAAKSRGGLFDRVMTGTDDASRTGFAWVEFRRGDETFTAGARLRASRASQKVDVNLFTTTLAVGSDLALLDDSRTPLSRKALVDAIGDSGRVHDSAEEHRAAVRETLFPGFGADRYAALIGAMLALRKEKLSHNLDLDKLSHVLSEALPQVDDHDIAAVAEGFERLDRRKAELEGLERELALVHDLARDQRSYARAVVVGVADEVRAAETRRDEITRSERTARGELEAAEQEAAAVAVERTALDDRDAAAAVEIDALKDSDAYRQGAALTDLREQAAKLRAHAEQLQANAESRRAEHAGAETEHGEATEAAAAAADHFGRAARELHEAGDDVGAGSVIPEDVTGDPDQGESLLRVWVRARHDQMREVRVALSAHADAIGRRNHHDRQLEIDAATVDERVIAARAAEQAVTAAVAAYNSAVSAWAGSCEHSGSARVAAALPTPADNPDAVHAAVGQLDADLRAEDATARQELRHRRDAVEAERAELLAERERWAGGEPAGPAAPEWRRDRTGRAGAPLWALVDIAPGVPAAEVDGLEAALAGAGLLDAWVTPDGTVDLAGDEADVVLTVRPAGTRTLADRLAPAADAVERHVVPATVVAAALASVALAETALSSPAEVVVATDGSYRLGSAVGRGPVGPAAVLGAVARERHRLAQLAEIDAALAAADARLAELTRESESLDRVATAIRAELAAVPPGDDVRATARAVADAEIRLGEAQSRLEQTRAARHAAEEEVRGALRALTALAARHGLPADADALAQVEQALSRLADTAAVWARRLRELQGTKRELARATKRLEETQRALARAVADQSAADRDASATEQRVAVLESSVGAAYAELSARIAALGEERRAGRERIRELSALATALAHHVGELTARVESAAKERKDAEDERDRVQQRLVNAFASLGDDAGISPRDALDTATAVLGAARAVAAEHERIDADPQTVERLSEKVRERVHTTQAALGARVDVERELTDGGWWVLRTTTSGVRRRAADLTAALRHEVEESRAELAADEERLFEQTLAGSVRRALAERIRLATTLVDGVNRQLDAVRTAAGGVHVRLRWDVDEEQPAAVRAARSLLLRDPADLSDAERQSLQDFVRARVDQARAELAANAPWEARLRDTLDYRAWHRFTLQLAHRDWEGFAPATAKRLQRLSTGERSIALHLPMIASLAAHYADPGGEPSGCPRLILLDELFAGVDASNRAQLFGTFTTWQLDAVFTSDHEWCQYATLDGVAIHHLHPPVGDEPVTSTRFTWDGHQRTVDPPAA